jgi:hypothetical protein
MDKDPKASTTSGLCSSSCDEFGGPFLKEGSSLCNGALIRRSSSLSKG